jgi:hypothetical protein
MTPTQCRAACAVLDLKQPQLAAAACPGLSTVVDFEWSRRSVSDAAIAALRATLEPSGIEFTNGGSAGGEAKQGAPKQMKGPAEKKKTAEVLTASGLKTYIRNDDGAVMVEIALHSYLNAELLALASGRGRLT